MTRWYWRQLGGMLIEEFPLVKRTATQARRLLDGLVILGEIPQVAGRGTHVDIFGKDVVVVQTKNSPLGMYLMGQTLFSLQLIEAFQPRSARAVALCAKDDARLRPLLEAYEGCEVVICPPEVCQTPAPARSRQRSGG
ncbi:MAG: hypothetical protein J5I81_02330 [Nitrococcus mobilis]|nr:hypothetical protein [Nitrococcus mobilis]